MIAMKSNTDSSEGKQLLSVCTLNTFFIFFTCCLFNNTHILCLLSDVTSYTDSVASHSQSGYPNRKVHVFLFFKLVYKLKQKKHPIMKLKLDLLILTCYRGPGRAGEQRLELSSFSLVDRITPTLIAHISF